MTFEAPEEIQFEEPLRSPHLDEKADREYDLMLDQGLAVPATAWKRVTKTHGVVKFAETDKTNSTDMITEDESDIPVAAPPKPGEPDREIEQRHRDALKARDASAPPDFDPETTERYLEKGRRGDFSSDD